MRAFFDSGGLKAGTPLEIASVPVIAVQPWANARQQQEEADRFARWAARPRRAARTSRPPAEEDAEQPVADQHVHQHHEHVGRNGEDGARLAHAAQVGERDAARPRRRTATRVWQQLGEQRGDAATPAAMDTETVST